MSNVFVDGLRTHDTVLELSHWPGNRTPPDLKGDVSTQAALALLTTEDARRDALIGSARAVTCDHYDIDGILSLWCLVEPEKALRHRSVLEHTAICGDFDVDTRDSAVQSCLALLAAEKSVQREILSGPAAHSVERATALLFEGMLGLVEECLADPGGWAESWGEEWADINRSRAYLDSRPDAMEEFPELDLAVLHDTEVPLHDYVVNSRTDCFHVLRTRPDGRHSLRFRYESFVDLQTRTPGPRVRGDILADELNEGGDSGTWFCESPATATPMLLMYGEDAVPAPSALPPAAMAAIAVDFFARARRQPALRWASHAQWFTEAPIAPPSKEQA
nr:DUF6687 family protein [Streptomyces sp. TSRI0281]